HERAADDLGISRVPLPAPEVHVLAAEGLFRVQLIVSVAEDAEVVVVVAAAACVRLHVVDLQEARRAAARAVGRNVRALRAVALERLAPRGTRDAASFRRLRLLAR